MADHNDPNGVNSIFSDIEVSPADLYDLFGFPVDGIGGDESALVALTFASIPTAGVFDTDMLYRIRITTRPRIFLRRPEGGGLAAFVRHLIAVKKKYLGWRRAGEVRVTFDDPRRAKVDFRGFREGDFSRAVEADKVIVIDTPHRQSIATFIGGRDDAFFNDLPGFFRSINYAPQFYRVPHTWTHLRELRIPKTLLELEGNDLFNFDPAHPRLGRGEKRELPPGPLTWRGSRFRKDENGNYRFVYSGEDAQAGKNVNAIVLEIPLSFLTASPHEDRIIDIWAESWVRRGTHKVSSIPDDPLWRRKGLWDALDTDDELRRYKPVDTVGQPFADAGLNEREDHRQVGANNFGLALHFVKRLAHLGWGFGPSISALGLKTSFDHDSSAVSVHKTYTFALSAFPRVRRTMLQRLNMPDETWDKRGLGIPLRRPFGIFVPNVCALDMDTTGTWPFGRRLEDQVATRFLSMFLDMGGEFDGKMYHVETLSDQSLWDLAPIEPKTPPNPLKNDKEFLDHFPYLAEPWTFATSAEHLG